jgi:putative sigma-54 modulation protein
MNIKINSVGFDASTDLQQFVNNKVNKLFKFSDAIMGAEVFLRLENAQSDDNKAAEIRLEIPGNDLFAKKQSDSFEKSLDNVVDALKRQLQKKKEKERGL